MDMQGVLVDGELMLRMAAMVITGAILVYLYQIHTRLMEPRLKRATYKLFIFFLVTGIMRVISSLLDPWAGQTYGVSLALIFMDLMLWYVMMYFRRQAIRLGKADAEPISVVEDRSAIAGVESLIVEFGRMKASARDLRR